MKHEDFDEIIRKTIITIESLSKLKGGEYAGDDDRLANFKRNAIALHLEPEQIWAVYTAKHWDAVMQYVRDIATHTTRTRLESIEGRLDDLVLYCILMKAIVQERAEENKKGNTL
jgi:hypothetical protein